MICRKLLILMETMMTTSSETPNPTPEVLPVPTVPLSKIDTRSQAEGKAIRTANGYQLERPRMIRKSRKRYGNKPEKQKKVGQMRYDGLLIPEYDVPTGLKAMLDAAVNERLKRAADALR
jgi:hypothetical protein